MRKYKICSKSKVTTFGRKDRNTTIVWRNATKFFITKWNSDLRKRRRQTPAMARRSMGGRREPWVRLRAAAWGPKPMDSGLGGGAVSGAGGCREQGGTYGLVLDGHHWIHPNRRCPAQTLSLQPGDGVPPPRHRAWERGGMAPRAGEGVMKRRRQCWWRRR